MELNFFIWSHQYKNRFDVTSNFYFSENFLLFWMVFSSHIICSCSFKDFELFDYESNFFFQYYCQYFRILHINNSFLSYSRNIIILSIITSIFESLSYINSISNIIQFERPTFHFNASAFMTIIKTKVLKNSFFNINIYFEDENIFIIWLALFYIFHVISFYNLCRSVLK